VGTRGEKIERACTERVLKWRVTSILVLPTRLQLHLPADHSDAHQFEGNELNLLNQDAPTSPTHFQTASWYNPFIMDETESLDALSNILSSVAERPYDISVHAQHVKLAQSLEGMEAEAQSAMEMMTQLVAAGDEVWLPLLDAKEQSVDLETMGGAEELLELYSRAERDYLCAYENICTTNSMLNRYEAIPILQKHLNFLVERHGLYVSGEQLRPETLEDVFTTTWTRTAIDEVVQKGLGHLTEVCIMHVPVFPISSFFPSIRVTNSGMFNGIGK